MSRAEVVIDLAVIAISVLGAYGGAFEVNPRGVRRGSGRHKSVELRRDRRDARHRDDIAREGLPVCSTWVTGSGIVNRGGGGGKVPLPEFRRGKSGAMPFAQTIAYAEVVGEEEGA